MDNWLSVNMCYLVILQSFSVYFLVIIGHLIANFNSFSSISIVLSFSGYMELFVGI